MDKINSIKIDDAEYSFSAQGDSILVIKKENGGVACVTFNREDLSVKGTSYISIRSTEDAYTHTSYDGDKTPFHQAAGEALAFLADIE